jgi:hypothetical protein
VTYKLTTIAWSIELYFEEDANDWVTACFSLTLVTNALSTGLVIYKTAQVHRELRFWGGSRALLVGLST